VWDALQWIDRHPDFQRQLHHHLELQYTTHWMFRYAPGTSSKSEAEHQHQFELLREGYDAGAGSSSR
jgi:hypothetical protein